MKYSRFEALMITLGGIVIVGSIFVAPTANPQWQELLGQALLLVVLAGAVHWGRDGGSVAAVAATLVYVVVRIPLLSTEGLSPAVVGMILTRMITFGVVGILGGEMFGRIKYFFARLNGASMLDEHTNVYNRAYCGTALKSGLGQFQRYQAPFAVALVSLAPGLLTDLRPSRQRSLLRNVASHIRNDIRLVDDVGYLGDGRFLLILPQTPKSGAEVAADRVRGTVRDLVGARDESVTATALAVPEDASAICDLARSLDPEVEPRLEDVCTSAESVSP
ncbi:MAG: GGDEF domain-containing protein [Coriobacteriia bacterium]